MGTITSRDDIRSGVRNSESFAEVVLTPRDIIKAGIAQKALIGICTMLGAILLTIVAFLVPVEYTATTVIMTPQESQSSASAMLSQLGLLGLGGGALNIKNPSELYIGLASSRTAADAVISRFHLSEVYHTNTEVSTRRKLFSNTRFEAGKDSLIRISVTDHDATRAAGMANAFVDELQKQNSRLAVTESAKRRLFFEQQLDKEKDELATAESNLKETEQTTGVFQVNSQVEAVIRSITQLQAEIASQEVALARLKLQATSENPQVIRQEMAIKALREQLASLQAGSNKKAGGPLLSTGSVPQAGLEYARKFRDVKYHENLFEFLSKQYEAARIDEAKEGPVIQVVDSAIPPDQKTWPPRALFILLGAFVGLLGSITWVVANERRRMLQHVV